MKKQSQNIFLINQIEFNLKTIRKPYDTQNYKIRIIINYQTAQQKIIKERPIQSFKLSIQNRQIKGNPLIYIILLQKQRRDENYLEIGKGEIDISEYTINNNNNLSVNGVIYGTRANNYDKIIAKYSYLIQKKAQLNQQHIQHGIGKELNIKFLNHKKKQSPVLKFNHSLLKESEKINNKLQSLSKPMDSNQSISKQNENNKKKLENDVISEKIMQQQEQKKAKYWLKFHQKIQRLLKLSYFEQLKCLYIKNIKLFKYIQNSNSKLTSKVYLNDSDIRQVSLQDQLIITMFSQRVSFKMLEICMQFNYNVDNEIIQSTKLFIQKSVSSIIIEVTSLNMTNTLRGQVNILYSRNKIVELFDTKGQERGFIVIQIEDSCLNPQFRYDQYQKQSLEFQKLQTSSRYSKCRSILNPSLFQQNMRSLDIQERYYQQQSKNRLNKNKSVLSRNQSPHISNIRYIQSKSRRASTEQTEHRQNGKIKSNISNFLLLRKNSTQSKKQDIYQRKLPQIAQRLPKLEVKILTIYLNYYLMSQAISSFILKFTINKATQIINISNGQNNLQQNDSVMIFKNVVESNNLTIQCYSYHKKRTSKIGTCNFRIEEFRHQQSGYRAFLVHKSAFVGYMILQQKTKEINQDNKKRILLKSSSVQPKYRLKSQIHKDQFELTLQSSESNTYKPTNLSQQISSDKSDELLQQSYF